MSESKGSYQAVEEQLEEVLRRVKEMGSTAASEGKSYWEAQCAKYRSEARERADTIAELRERLESMTDLHTGGNEREEFLMGQIEKRLPYAAREIATIISELREKLEADAKLVALVRQILEREAS